MLVICKILCILSKGHYSFLCYIIKVVLLLVGFLELEPFATLVSVKPNIKFSCTEPNIGLQSLAQHHIDFYLKWLVQSRGRDFHLLVVKESLPKLSLHEKKTGRQYLKS